MRVKVIKMYVDKHTKELMEVETFTKYSEERANELIENGYVVAVKEPKPTKKTEV